jgi:thimet oligopeptidase
MHIIQTASVIFLLGGASSGALAAPSVAEILAKPLVAPASVTEVQSRCDAHASAVKASRASFEAMPLNTSRMKLLRAYDDLYNLSGLLAYAEHYLVQETNPDEAIRKAAEACVVRGAELLTKIGMSRPIFERLNAINAPGLDPKLRYTVERQLDNYRRNGVDRDEATRTRIAELQNAITATGLEFQKNIRDDIKTLAFKPADLEGLPADYLAHSQARCRRPGADQDGVSRYSTDNAICQERRHPALQCRPPT